MLFIIIMVFDHSNRNPEIGVFITLVKNTVDLSDFNTVLTLSLSDEYIN